MPSLSFLPSFRVKVHYCNLSLVSTLTTLGSLFLLLIYLANPQTQLSACSKPPLKQLKKLPGEKHMTTPSLNLNSGLQISLWAIHSCQQCYDIPWRCFKAVILNLLSQKLFHPPHPNITTIPWESRSNQVRTPSSTSQTMQDLLACVPILSAVLPFSMNELSLSLVPISLCICAPDLLPSRIFRNCTLTIVHHSLLPFVSCSSPLKSFSFPLYLNSFSTISLCV